MLISNVLPSNAVKAGATTSVIAAVQSATPGSIEVAPWVYTSIAVLLALAGVVMARLVTVTDENKRLRRKQSWQETWPLTFIGVLIVCPFIWHFHIEIPYASVIGLGVGYSVRVVLKIFGSGATAAARAAVRAAAEGFDDQEEPAPLALPRRPGPAGVLPADTPLIGGDHLADDLDQLPASPGGPVPLRRLAPPDE